MSDWGRGCGSWRFGAVADAREGIVARGRGARGDRRMSTVCWRAFDLEAFGLSCPCARRDHGVWLEDSAIRRSRLDRFRRVRERAALVCDALSGVLHGGGPVNSVVSSRGHLRASTLGEHRVPRKAFVAGALGVARRPRGLHVGGSR